MTPTELQDAATVWAGRLGLGNWDLDVKHIHRIDTNGDCVGESTIAASREAATIRVVFGAETVSDQSWLSSEDEEVTLVHELVHILFDGFEPAPGDHHGHVRFEHGVDMVARILVSLGRLVGAT